VDARRDRPGGEARQLEAELAPVLIAPAADREIRAHAEGVGVVDAAHELVEGLARARLEDGLAEARRPEQRPAAAGRRVAVLLGAGVAVVRAADRLAGLTRPADAALGPVAQVVVGARGVVVGQQVARAGGRVALR